MSDTETPPVILPRGAISRFVAGIRAFRKLIDNPADPLHGPIFQMCVEHGLIRRLARGLERHGEGRRLLAERPRLDASAVSLAAVAALPPSSLGRAYAAYFEDNKIVPFDPPQAARRDPRGLRRHAAPRGARRLPRRHGLRHGRDRRARAAVVQLRKPRLGPASDLRARGGVRHGPLAPVRRSLERVQASTRGVSTRAPVAVPREHPLGGLLAHAGRRGPGARLRARGARGHLTPNCPAGRPACDAPSAA